MSEHETTRIRVLAIEDDPADQVVLERLCESIDDVDLQLAGSASEGLTLFGRVEPDVVVLDHKLGADTGLTVLGALQESDPDCPVVFLTGMGNEALAVAALKSGATDYLPKSSLSANSLHRAITNAVEQGRLRKLVRDHRTTLEQTNQELERRNREIEGFYHNVSHELRTPLTAIMEFVTMIHEGIAGPTTPEQMEYLGIVQDSCEQMRLSIEDLLDITRAETGKLSIDPSSRDVDALVARIVRSMEPVAVEKGLSLSYTVLPELPPVWADSNRVAQILRNLVGNAIKFTASGGRVHVRAERDVNSEDFIRVSVIDTGRGIPEDQLPWIFDRLHQVDASELGTPDGLGLGLSICRELVMRHGGEIDATSELGSGSTFRFTLPIDTDVPAMHSGGM